MRAEAPKPQKNPFSAPLDFDQLHEFFRRLEARTPAEQAAFVRRINWNLLDAGTEHRLVSWLIGRLRSAEPDVALEVLGKLPRYRRGRYAPRLSPLVGTLPPETARALAALLPGLRAPKPAPAPKQARPPATPKAASEADLSQLKDFFGKFGGAR